MKQEIAAKLIEVGKRLDEKGLVTGAEGNISARFSESRVLITASGTWLGLLNPSDFIEIDLDGKMIAGEGSASSETMVHLAAYRSRDDVQAVIHAHPPYAIARSLSGKSFDAVPIPEAAYMFGAVPSSRFAVPGTHEGGEAISQLVKGHDAIVLERHGVVALGPDPMLALARVESIEKACRILGMTLSEPAARKLYTPEEVERIYQRATSSQIHPQALLEWKENMLAGISHTE